MSYEYIKDHRTGVWYPNQGQGGWRADLEEDEENGEPILRCTYCDEAAYTLEKYARAAAKRGLEHYMNHNCGWWHLERPQIILRDYQEAAHDSIYEYFGHHSGNPIVAMPTGTGKSVVIAEFIRRALANFPGTRVVCLTHVKELIEQNFDTLLKVWPTAPAGVYSAGLGRRDQGQAVTFAGIQSVYKYPEMFGPVDLIIIDECHLVSPKGETMYGQFIEGAKKISPQVKVIGFSATPYRMKHGMLTDDDGIFTDVAFDLTERECFNWLIAQEYLVPLIPRQMDYEYDVTSLKVQGDFVQSELQDRVNVEELTLRILNEAVPLAAGRKKWLVFASGIDHAEWVAWYLDDIHGIPSMAVHSKMDEKERDAAIEDFRSGQLMAIVNYNVLTTGFDVPDIDFILMLRPTLSPGLWVQMIGRGTRPAPNKKDCLVFDYAGNTKRLGPINDPVLPHKRGNKQRGIAPVRVCEHCHCYSHASCRFCEVCGKEFPKNLKLTAQPSIEELVAGNIPEMHTLTVDNVVYRVHKKKNRPDSMRVDYQCGLRRFTEYICLDHGGYAARQARRWWRERCPWGVPPSVADGMLAIDHLRVPVKINIIEKTRYPEICGYEFNG